MSVRMAVLGLVIERPGYGYDLAQRLEERCGAWRWNSTGVYGALSTLEREGHVKGRDMAGEARRPGAQRAIFDATDIGREHFRAWMLALSEPAPVRQDLDLKLALATPELLPEMIELTRVQEQQCMDALQLLTSKAKPPAGIGSWHEAALVLERNREIRQLRGRIEWLEEVRAIAKMLIGQRTLRAG
jgi:DNA-binding PadR family transcriptional regulator